MILFLPVEGNNMENITLEKWNQLCHHGYILLSKGKAWMLTLDEKGGTTLMSVHVLSASVMAAAQRTKEKTNEL